MVCILSRNIQLHLTSTATNFSISEVILQRFVYLYIAGRSSLKQSEKQKLND